MRYLTIILAFFCSVSIQAQEAIVKTFDERVNDAVLKYTSWFVDLVFYKVGPGIPWVLIVLIVMGVFFTLYFKFINIRAFGTAIQVVRGKFDHVEEFESVAEKSARNMSENGGASVNLSEETHIGEVSHFQALTTSLSATVGLGNIAGVAVALSIGGPGATFWMILAGFLGMSLKFVECTLGVKYREIDADGTVYGGPMYYLTKGLKEKGMARFGKVLAMLFAIMCVGGSFGVGSMFQSNQAYKIFEKVTGAENSFFHEKGYLFGLIIAFFVGTVIIGGMKKIATVTAKIVPLMVFTYLLAGLVTLFMNRENIPWAFGQIYEGAFTATGISGGVLGVIIQGFKRAAFSNEAGIGSAPIAHSAVKTRFPASEGLVSLIGPFIDTVVICTMTALVIIVSGKLVVGADLNTDTGVLLTSEALATSISWFPYVLAFAVILFAFSTMISWSYYGLQAWTYLFSKSKLSQNLYKVLFCSTVVIGASVSLSAVIDFTDAMVFAMLVPNMIGLVILMPEVKKELNRYMLAIKKG